jgi:hypothetical protein
VRYSLGHGQVKPFSEIMGSLGAGVYREMAKQKGEEAQVFADVLGRQSK